MVGFYSYIKGIKENKGICLLTSGVFIGLGYLVKSTALIALLVIGGWILVRWVKERSFNKKNMLIFFGLLLIFLLEGLYYQLTADCFFLRPTLISKVYKSKYSDEWLPLVAQCDLKWILIKYPLGTVLQQIKTLLNLFHQRPEFSYIGYFYYLIFFSFPYLLFKKIPNRSYIFSWFFLIYLFVEFGPLEIKFGLSPFITYGLIEKQPRYLTVLLAPSVIFLSLLFVHLKIPFKKLVVVIIMVFLLVSSYQCVGSAHEFFRVHTRDLREATKYLQTLPSSKNIYTDWLAMDQVYFYSKFQAKNLRNIVDLPDASGQDYYVVLGGSRGSGVLASYFEKEYRELLLHIPTSWILLKTIPNKKNKFRNRNLTIYYVPKQESRVQ
jgi:hypothetical protein